jgi:hypothetical protein
MRGPYPLSPLAVDLRVPCHVGGVYCLAKKPGGPVVKVCRAEQDMREELRASSDSYQSFWYETCLTPDETYSAHCRHYHRYVSSSTLEDGTHPTPPAKA